MAPTSVPVSHRTGQGPAVEGQTLHWPAASPAATLPSLGWHRGLCTKPAWTLSSPELSDEGWRGGCDRKAPWWSDSSHTWPRQRLAHPAACPTVTPRPFPDELCVLGACVLQGHKMPPEA